MDTQRVGKVQTVRGLIDPEQMSITMMHEHLLIDFRCRYQPASEISRVVFAESAVTPNIRQDLLQDPFANLDNLLLLDEQEAIEEAMQFKLAGGGTVVDTTTVGLGRDPLALRRISTSTGLNVSMGAGYYVYLSHPKDMDSRSEDQIYQEIVHDVNEGVGDTGIKCGHIGEIGCEELTRNEMKVVRAAARAQRTTGAMLNIHQLWQSNNFGGNRIADEVDRSGGDLHRTVFSHMDGTEVNFDYQVSLLQRGITIEYDIFGMECYFPDLDLETPRDSERVRGIARLTEAGWVGQVVIAQDICMKMMLERTGGWGYGHILKRVLPRFRKAGLTEEHIRTILVDNPKRLLPFVAGTS